jgi:hypothetical protein
MILLRFSFVVWLLKRIFLYALVNVLPLRFILNMFSILGLIFFQVKAPQGDLAKYFNHCHGNLIETLKSLFPLLLWLLIFCANEDCHNCVAWFVIVDSELEKSVIGLSLIDVSHSSKNIAKHISCVLEDYRFIGKTLLLLGHGHPYY